MIEIFKIELTYVFDFFKFQLEKKNRYEFKEKKWNTKMKEQVNK